MADVDTDLNRLLAPLRDQPLAEPEPLPDLESRAARIRRRRWAGRLSVAAGAAAVALVAVTLLPNAADQSLRTTPPADAPADPPAPPQPRSHEAPPQVPRIAEMVVDGQPWSILAGYDAEGHFCSGLEMAGMGTFSCGDGRPFEPGEVITAAPAQDMRMHRGGETLPPWEPPLLTGLAEKAVATVRVEFRGGGRAETPVIGSEAGLPVNFYWVTLPFGAEIEAVVALDAGGREIARLEAPFWWERMPPPPCEPPTPDAGPCSPVFPAPPGAVSVGEQRTPPTEAGGYSETYSGPTPTR